jgi:hypothetical protein
VDKVAQTGKPWGEGVGSRTEPCWSKSGAGVPRLQIRGIALTSWGSHAACLHFRKTVT